MSVSLSPLACLITSARQVLSACQPRLSVSRSQRTSRRSSHETCVGALVPQEEQEAHVPCPEFLRLRPEIFSSWGLESQNPRDSRTAKGRRRARGGRKTPLRQVLPQMHRQFDKYVTDVTPARTCSRMMSLSSCDVSLPTQGIVVRPRRLDLGALDPNAADTVADSAVFAYLGIPYAAPPVGELRWKIPQRPQRAHDSAKIRESRWQPDAPQPIRDQLSLSKGRIDHKTAIGQSEDCLTLNIWVPAGVAQDEQARKPVAVWIHGELTARAVQVRSGKLIRSPICRRRVRDGLSVHATA